MIIVKVIVPKGKDAGTVQVLEPPIGVIGSYDAKGIIVQHESRMVSFRSSITVEEKCKEPRVFDTEVELKYDLLEYDEELLRP